MNSTNEISIAKFDGGRYVVFNGWKNGRRQAIYSTYRKELADAEYESRVAGNKPNIKMINN